MSIKQPLESIKEYMVTFWTKGWRMNYIREERMAGSGYVMIMIASICQIIFSKVVDNQGYSRLKHSIDLQAHNL